MRVKKIGLVVSMVSLTWVSVYTQELTFSLQVHEYSNTVKYANKLLTKSRKWLLCAGGQRIDVDYANNMFMVDTVGLANECKEVFSGKYIDLYFDFRNECRVVKLPNLFVSDYRSFEVRIDKPKYKSIVWLFVPRRYFGRHTYTFWYRDPFFAVNSWGAYTSVPCEQRLFTR